MTTSPWVRALLLGAVGLVVGLVLGGVGPRAEVRRLQDRVFELEREAARSGPGLSREIANILTNPRGMGAEPLRAEGGREPDPFTEDGGGEGGTPDVRMGPDKRDDEPLEDGVPGGEPPMTFTEELDHARELLTVRSAQAKAALYEDIRPSGEQEARIDAVLADMNDQLFDVTRDFLDRTRGGEVAPRRDMMALGADVLDILTTAESSVLDQMTPSQRAAVREEATDPTSFVDPGLLDLVAEYDDLPERLREGGP